VGPIPSSDERRKILTLLNPLERANLTQWIHGLNRVGIFLPSSEDGNRSSFQNEVFLVFRIPDDGQVQHLSNSECYILSSKYFRFQIQNIANKLNTASLTKIFKKARG
jgi:hypothetical protein